MSLPPDRRTFLFGPYLLDLGQRQLLREGKLVPLRPKIFDTLRALVENHGRLLHKDELMAMVWPDTAVDESNLTHNLSVLRKSLGQNDKAQYIVTLPGRGYRFIAPVEAPLEGSVAVRPFSNLSPDPEQDFFCDGMAEELIDALASVEGLRVVGRTSSFDRRLRDLSSPEVGEKLRVSAILEGSVRKAGERLRISAHLIRTSDGTQLWSEHYDRELGDVFEIQEDIARAIVNRLRRKLLAPHPGPIVKRPTQSQEVYQLYLEARYHLGTQMGDRVKQAINLLDRALDMQPDFAQGHAVLALCYGTLAVDGFLRVGEAASRAEEAVQTALELSDTSATAYRACGLLRAALQWDWPAAQRAYLRALRLDPGNPNARFSYGHYFLAPVGRLEEAEQELKTATHLDPLAPMLGRSLCFVYYLSRRYEEALAEARRTLAIDSTYPATRSLAAACYSAMDRPDEAVRERQVYLRNAGRPADADTIGRVLETEGEQGVLRWSAARLLKRADNQNAHYDSLAILHAWLGERDAALHWLEEAIRVKRGVAMWAKVHPAFDELRSETRFHELLNGMGVNDPRVATPGAVA